MIEKTNRTLALQQKIADDAARSDIECNLDGSIHSGRHHGWWYTADEIDPERREMIEDAITYLELRGLLKRHPENPSLIRPLSPS
jgi:hypothetical protein